MNTRALALLPFLLLAGSPLWGQLTPEQRQLADLREDVAYLREQVRVLRLEVEQITRENNRLREEVSGDTVASADLESRLQALRSDFAAADKASRQQIVREVESQMAKLAAQTNKALEALAKALETRPEVTPQVVFSNDYPKEGIAYTVQAGDTLSGIARKFGSSVKDIQNANRIADPASLQAGDTIFVPRRSGD